VNITPASTYAVVDHGLQTAWQGSPNGDRATLKPLVTRSLAWTELRTLPPERGELGKQLAAVQLIHEALDEDVPLIMTVYSPLAQAAQLTEPGLLLRHMRTRADRLRSGLSILTENTLRFLEALQRTPISGIYYVLTHADHEQLSAAEYSIFGLPYDRKVLSEFAAGWWLNVLHVQGQAPIFDLVKDFNVQAINWNTSAEHPNLPEGKSLILGAVCGGLLAANLTTCAPSAIRSQAHEALGMVNGRRMILAAEGTVPITAPLSNLRAVRAAVEPAKGVV